MKHTKGPWKVLETENGNLVTNVKDNQLVTDFIQSLSNARLIAAAPELLTELKQALNLIQSIERETGYVTSVTQNHWTKLIAKAEGSGAK